jgi:5-methylcytosine-specific restriction endonuclease McrA
MIPCLVCGRLTEKSRCPDHPRARAPSTRAWHAPGAAKLRRRILRRDGYLCTRCGRLAAHVHHIIPAAAGGSNDPSNLTSLCADCHRRAHENG